MLLDSLAVNVNETCCKHKRLAYWFGWTLWVV